MKNKRFIFSVCSILAVLLIGGTSYGAYELTKKHVTLSFDGKDHQIRTHANSVGEILDEFEISIRPEDILSHPVDEEITDEMKIVWEAAKPVVLIIDDEQTKIWTTEDTVKDLFADQTVDFTEHDIIEPGLDAEITKEMTIEVDKAFQLTLDVGGDKQQVWSTSTTVADFLEGQNITLADLDRVEPAMEKEITEDSVVKVTRVEKVTDVVEEPISYAVVTKKDNSLEKGKEKVERAGEEGKVEKHYEVILENGKEVSRELKKTDTVKDSVNKVVAVGTKVIQQPKQQIVSRGNQSSSKEFYVTSTAYTANCSGCSGTTKTGINLKANPNSKVIAVDPSVIPLGTKVYVEGYGYAVAGDTGSAIRGNKIDVFFPDKSQAFRWGNKKVKIKILN